MTALFAGMKMPRHTKAYILHHKNEEPFWSEIYMNIIFKLPSFFIKVKTLEGRYFFSAEF